MATGPLAVNSKLMVAKILNCDGINEDEFKTALGGVRGLYLGSYKNSILRAWILSLKGGGFFEDFILLAQQLLRRRHIAASSSSWPLLNPVVIVPSPARKKFSGVGKEGSLSKVDSPDHAASLASALSKVTGWPVLDILTFALDVDEMKEQKDQSLSQRRQRKFQLKEPGVLDHRQARILKPLPTHDLSPLCHGDGETMDHRTDFIEYGTIIFIDDVVTTGSTARAAWKALGCPDFFEVWCIAFQPKSTK